MPPYSDEFRAMAVALLYAAGYPQVRGVLKRTAESLGVPPATLSHWARGEQHPPPAQLLQQKQSELMDVLRHEIDRALAYMPDKIDEAKYLDLVRAIEILIKRIEGLRGTENVSHEPLIEIRGVIDDVPVHDEDDELAMEAVGDDDESTHRAD